VAWSQVVKGRLDIRKIPGSHETMLAHPGLAVLAQQLGNRLAHSAKSQHMGHSPTRNEAQGQRMSSLLQYNGG